MQSKINEFERLSREHLREQDESLTRITELHQDYMEAQRALAESALSGTRYQSRADDVATTRQRWLDAVVDARELHTMTSARLATLRNDLLTDLTMRIN